MRPRIVTQAVTPRRALCAAAMLWTLAPLHLAAEPQAGADTPSTPAPQAPAVPGLTSLDLLECNSLRLRDDQVAHCRAQKSNAFDRKVSRVSVAGRWGRRAPALPVKVGDTLTSKNQSDALHALSDFIHGRSSTGYLDTLGAVEVLYISVEYQDGPTPGTVEVTFVPRFVHLSMVKVGDNVLPIPRPRVPRPLDEVPEVLKRFKPSATAAYDRGFGTSLSAAIGGEVFERNGRKLTVAAAGRASLDEPLHTADGAMGYEWKRDTGSLRSAAVAVGYEDSREPLADDIHSSDSRSTSAGLVWKVATNRRAYFDAAWRSTHDSLAQAGLAPTEQAPGDSQSIRAMFEAITGGAHSQSLGFLRAALWAGTHSAGGALDETYQSAVLRLAYSKELSLSPGQTVGFEVMAGGGRIWGNAPDYARYFGGNSPQRFLYDSPSAHLLLERPTGPVLRSMGQGAAGIPVAGGVVGGTRFWHANADITVPVRKWSSPLIPNEDTGLTDRDGNSVGLKTLMDRQVNVSGRAFLRGVLGKQFSTPEEAEARTNEVMDEISPAATYIIRDANLWAVKPLIVLDAAGLSGPQGSETWLTAGLGVQVTVVTARFEAGYARTVHGPTFGERGAPYARLVFHRLF